MASYQMHLCNKHRKFTLHNKGRKFAQFTYLKKSSISVAMQEVTLAKRHFLHFSLRLLVLKNAKLLQRLAFSLISAFHH